MRKTIVKFQCDNCSKELTKVEDGTDRDFPWTDGWIELHNIDIGAPKNATHRLIDQPQKIELEERDFCGQACILNFIKKQLVAAGGVDSVGTNPGDGRIPEKPQPFQHDENIVSRPTPRPQQRPNQIQPQQPYQNPEQPRTVRFDEPEQRNVPPQKEIVEEVTEPKKKKRLGIFG